MGIVTDSTPLEAPKDPDADTVFALYRLLASPDEVEAMRKNYLGGNYGYGHAKKALYECLLHAFGEARERFHYYMGHKQEIDEALETGAERAKKVADDVLSRVRERLGY
jgi:tryptophanyl-tRNA synthetase